MWQTVGEAPVANALRVEVGPERIILTDGLQPVLLRTSKGTLYVHAGASTPPGWGFARRNIFPFAFLRHAISRDGGDTWKRWLPASEQGVGPVTEGCAAELSDGAVLMLEWIASGPTSKGEWGGGFWESHDDLETLEGPEPMTIHLPQGRGGFDDCGNPYSGLTFHRTLLQLPDGDLLATCYGWFEGDVTPCPYRPEMCKFRCILLRSSDRGRHWRYVATIAVDPDAGEEGFDEPVMVRLSKGPKAGRLVCLMRTGSNDCPVYQSHSDDEGVTWSAPRVLPFGGVDPDLVEMADGTLACSFGWRIWGGGEMQNYYLVFSPDQGETWTNLTVLPMAPAPAVEHQRGTWYSAVREVEPGVLFVTYDVGDFPQDWPVKYIAGRRVSVRRVPQDALV